MKFTRKFLLAIIALTLMLVAAVIPLTANAAESGTCGDNLTWTLDDNGTLTISGKGEMKFGIKQACLLLFQ